MNWLRFFGIIFLESDKEPYRKEIIKELNKFFDKHKKNTLKIIKQHKMDVKKQ